MLYIYQSICLKIDFTKEEATQKDRFAQCQVVGKFFFWACLALESQWITFINLSLNNKFYEKSFNK